MHAERQIEAQLTLALRHSHPRWLVERWIARFGVDAARRLTEADNSRPELYLRALGHEHTRVPAKLAERGIATEPFALLPRALRVVEGTAAAALEAAALEAAPVIVQEIERILNEIKALGITTIIVEQNAIAALNLADRAVILDTGEVAFTGMAKDVLDNADLRQEYLAI